jgi:hypothetical protein
MLDSAPFERECSSVRATYGVRTPTTPTTPVEVRGVPSTCREILSLHYTTNSTTYLAGKSSENTLRSLQGNLPTIYVLVYIVMSQSSLIVLQFIVRAAQYRTRAEVRRVGVRRTTCWHCGGLPAVACSRRCRSCSTELRSCGVRSTEKLEDKISRPLTLPPV